MKQYDYLIIGGGMTGDAAIQGIREMDVTGSIGLVSAEVDPPYNRPPLSKGLWKGKRIEQVWRKSETRGAELMLDCRAIRLLPDEKRVILQDGEIVAFGKLLLATGGRPRRLPWGGDQIIYLRTLQDYRRLRALAAEAERITVIGAGLIGSEIAAALAMNGKQVTLVMREPNIYGGRVPRDLGEFLNRLYRDKGVELIGGQNVTGVERQGRRLVVHTRGTQDHSEREVGGDAVVAGLGLVPNVELAREAGLYTDDGIWVDELLRASHPDVLAAGDVASFHLPALGRRRVEHEDNAETMGRAAGRNMAGAGEVYSHLPYFYSDLFEYGYEAVGEMDSEAEQVAVWKRPFQEGTIYYLRNGRLRGILNWNLYGQVERARELLSAQRTYNRRDVEQL